MSRQDSRARRRRRLGADALRRLLDRKGIVITDADIAAEVQTLKSRFEVEKELGPVAAEYVKVSEMREILRRLLDKKK